MVLNFFLEKLATITLNLSNFFSFLNVKIVEKLNVNIYKPKHEREILRKTTEIKEDTKTILKNQEEFKKYKKREKLIKEIISQDIININNLNSVSESEYYLVLVKLHLVLGKNKDMRKVIFGKEGSFNNSIDKYFLENNFIKIGKKYSGIYLKNRNDLKKNYQSIFVFKKILDEKFKNLIKQDNLRLIKLIEAVKTKRGIKEYFYDSKGSLKTKNYLFLDYMIISSLNLNKENITLVDKNFKQRFIAEILKQEMQDVQIKDIIKKSGLRFFLNKKYPLDVKEILLKKESSIKKELKINNFLEEINKEDLVKVFMKILKEEYKKEYAEEFFEKYNLIRGF